MYINTQKNTHFILKLLLPIFLLLTVFSFQTAIAHAEDLISLTGPVQNKAIPITVSGSTYDKTGSVLIKNTCSQRLRLDITLKVVRAESKPADDMLASFSCYNFSGTVETISGSVFMEPGNSGRINFRFQSMYAGGTSITITARKETAYDNGGKSFQAPKSMAINGTENGILRAGIGNGITRNRFYSIETGGKYYLNLGISSESENKPVSATIYRSGDTSMKNPLGTVKTAGRTRETKVFLPAAGKYVISVKYENAGNNYTTYSLTLGGRGYIQATGISLTCNQRDLTLYPNKQTTPKTYTFTATTIPANSDDKLDSIVVSGGLSSVMNYTSNIAGKNSASFTVTAPVHTAGYAIFKVKSKNGRLSNAIEIDVAPRTPSISLYQTNPTQINFCNIWSSSSTKTKSIMKVYLKSGNTWVLKNKRSGSGKLSVNKLKGNTSYQFKFTESSQRSNGTWIEGAPLYKTIKTPSAQKPVIKSIKVSNVSVRSKYVWKYSSVKHGYTWEKTYYTNFKVTITLKNKLDGFQNVYIDNLLCKVKGNKIVANMSVSGNKKGKSYTLKIQPFYKRGDIYGNGTSITKKVKIR